MMIRKNTPSELQLLVKTFGHSIYFCNQSKFITVPKVVEPTNKKTLGTSVTNNPMSPLNLIKINENKDDIFISCTNIKALLNKVVQLTLKNC